MQRAFLFAILTMTTLISITGCTTSITATAENSPILANPGAKKMNLISVTPTDITKVPYMIQEAKRSALATGVKRKAFKFGIYPSYTLQKVQEEADVFGQIKEGLKDTDVEPGILIVVSVGQGWTVGAAPLEPMEYAVNQLGELNYRICMRDKKFRKYIHDAIVAYAKKKPAFILMDDDFRLLNNSAYGTECFCDSHMKIYNEKMPRKFADAKALVEYLKNAPADDPCVRIFEAERRATLLDHAKLIRDAIDSVDPTIPCGYCSGGGEIILAGEIARALAGKNKSFLRIHNANYLELEPQQFNLVMYLGAYRARMAGNVDYILDESDTYGRNRYCKSAVSMHSHITGAILNGCSGAKLWLNSLINVEVMESNKRYEEIVKANRQFYDALLAEMEHVTWQGPVTPLLDFSQRFNPARASESGTGLLMDIQVNQLNRFGIPARFEFINGNDVYLLNGSLAKSMTDDELKTVLSAKAIVDGHAALEIARRGLNDYLGCLPKLETFYPGPEKMNFEPGYLIPIYSNGTIPNLTNVAPEAQIITTINPCPGTEGKGATPGPGCILYKNAHGGTVVTHAMAVGISRISDEMPEVKMLYLELFRRLDPKLINFYIGEEQPVYFRCGAHNQGGYLLALVNLSYDPLIKLDLRTKESVRSVEFLDGDGIYKPLIFTSTEKGILVEKRLDCYAPLILRVK